MKIKQNLAAALVYISAYLGGTTFALVGGFFLLKCDDEPVKKALKTALKLFVVFLCVDAVVLVLNNIFSIIWISRVINIVAKVFAVLKVVSFGFMAYSAYVLNPKDPCELNVR